MKPQISTKPGLVDRTTTLAYQTLQPGTIPDGRFVCLLGTMGQTTWIDHVLDLFARTDRQLPLKAFDPRVESWDRQAVLREEDAKQRAAYWFIHITDPLTAESAISSYSLVELTIGLHSRQHSTVVVFDLAELRRGDHIGKQLWQAKERMQREWPDAHFFDTLEEAVDWLAPRLMAQSSAAVERTWEYRRIQWKVAIMALWIRLHFLLSVAGFARVYFSRFRLSDRERLAGALLTDKLRPHGLRVVVREHHQTQDDGYLMPHVEVHRL